MYIPPQRHKISLKCVLEKREKIIEKILGCVVSYNKTPFGVIKNYVPINNYITQILCDT